MNRVFFQKQRTTLLMALIGILLTGILLAIPTGYEDALIYQGSERAIGLVTEADNSSIVKSGIVQSGEQICKMIIQTGTWQGQEITGVNFLSGSLEQDKIYQEGDRAFVRISVSGGEVSSCVMSDHFRLGKEAFLFLAFVVLLIAVAGKKGVLALFSFVIAILSIWKILVPAYLNGYSPVWTGIAVTVFIILVIIFFVYGFERRTVTASMGALLGVAATCILGIVFTDLFQIHGAIMPDSESLLYSGFQDLDLTAIFMSSIFIGASGAMVDLSVDITSAVYEVVEKKPEISWREAFASGMHVARAAMGTMTATLLLAYSGGYLTSLMVYMAQGTPVDHILNYKYVAAELLDTLVGCFGVVAVAPFTALTAGLLLTRRQGRQAQCPVRKDLREPQDDRTEEMPKERI